MKVNYSKLYPTMVIRSQAEAIELLEKENERLNNIINKLEKYANRRIDELKEQENKLNIKLTSELNELYTFLGMIIGLKGDSSN